MIPLVIVPRSTYRRSPPQKVDRAQGSDRPTATPEVFDTQMAHNDYWSLLYRSKAIMIAEVVTGASCNDPKGD